MSRNVRIFAILAGIVVALLLILYHKTLIGIWDLKCGTWAADRYIQRDVSDMKAVFDPSGMDLLPLYENANPLVASGEATRNQRVYRISNGKSYLWFPFGAAQNLGYVVTDTTNGHEIVLKVVRRVEIDGP